MTKLQQMLAELQKQVIAQNYYIYIYVNCLNKHEMSMDYIYQGAYSDDKIVDMANDFWLNLPDSPEIRTGPFWLLCDICEASPSNC